MFADTWQAFQAATHTLGPTPGLRSRWHAGRQAYFVWMVRLDDPRLRERVAAVQRTLEPWLDPQPLDQLHITICVAGFPAPRTRSDSGFPLPDHVDPAALQSTLQRLNCAPPTLDIGGANSFTSAVFLEVQDADATLADLRSRVRGSLDPETRNAPWLPHVTVGSWRRRVPVRDVLDGLRLHRRWAPIRPTHAVFGLASIDPRSGHISTFESASDK